MIESCVYRILGNSSAKCECVRDILHSVFKNPIMFFFFAFSVDQEDQLLQSRLVLLLVLAEGTQGHSPTFDLCYLAEDMNLFHKVLHII